MDTTIATNILLIISSIFLVLVATGFMLLVLRVASVLKKIKLETEKVAQNIESVRTKILGSMLFIKKLFKK